MTCLVPYIGGRGGNIWFAQQIPRQGAHMTDRTTQRPDKRVNVARSISMNQGVGCIDPGFAAAQWRGIPNSGIPGMPNQRAMVDGQRPNGNHTQRSLGATFGKNHRFSNAVSPSDIFFDGGRKIPTAINDASLAVDGRFAKMD